MFVRIHQSGDFFSQAYFDSWVLVAQAYPDKKFYGYTKALNFWVNYPSQLPKNLYLVASRGGKFDNLIDKFGLRSVTVVFSTEQAQKAKLPIDHDDSLVWNYKGNFAILLHGTQPAGTPAAQAWYKIKYNEGGYKATYFDHYAEKDKAKREALLNAKVISQRKALTV